MGEDMQEGGPFYDNELKDIFSNAKKAALAHFHQKAVGDVKDDFLGEFKEKMKNKYNQLK